MQDDNPIEPQGEPSPDAPARDEVASLGEKAGHVAMSTLLAASLSSALAEPPRTEHMTLPDPVPIVQTLEEEHEPAPEPQVEVEDEDDRWDRIRRILKFLLLALAVALAIVLAVTRGCVSCAAPLLTQDEREEQWDERGQEDADADADAQKAA